MRTDWNCGCGLSSRNFPPFYGQKETSFIRNEHLKWCLFAALGGCFDASQFTVTGADYRPQESDRA